MPKSSCILIAAVLMIHTLDLAAQTPPNRWQSIHGQPRLILGIYEAITDDAVLANLADAGFNLVNTVGDSESLDRLHRHGLYAWVNLGGDLAIPTPEKDTGQAEALSARINRLKDHPAMLVWEGPDEPLWNIWYARLNQYWKTKDTLEELIDKLEGDEGVELRGLLNRSNDLHARGYLDQADELLNDLQLRLGESVSEALPTWAEVRRRAYALGDALTRGFKLVKQLDPNGIRWINHAPRNSLAALRHYNHEVEMAGCDIYPVSARPISGHSDLVNQLISSAGAYTRRMAAAAPGKSVAMVLQGFAWADIGHADKGKNDNRPNFNQTRFMAYDALLNGAAAIMWFGTAYIPKDCELWQHILATARELRALEPALTAPPLEASVHTRAEEIYGSHDGEGPTVMLRRTGEDYVLIALNATRHGLAFRVEDLPGPLDGRRLHRLGTEESHLVTHGAFSDGIQAFDAHVYATSRRFERKYPYKTPR